MSAEYSTRDGLNLALSYLNDPSDVECPSCGHGSIEVVAYLESEGESTRLTAPEGTYTVVLHCHTCGRSAALDMTTVGIDEGAA